MYIRLFFFVLLSVCGLNPLQAHAQGRAPSGFKPGGVHHPLPNLDLPERVPAPLGKLTFFADFADYTGQFVPIYVVNRTSEIVEFPCQDGDMYIKLEHQRPDGKWERAQGHGYSDCGNSYYSASLNPGQHFRLYGYMPPNGVPSKVRFANYQDRNFISNEADGFVRTDIIEAARMDEMSRNAPRQIAEALDLESIARIKQQVSMQRQIAAVRLLQVYGGNLFYKKCAETLAKTWEDKQSPTKDEAKGAKIIRELLAVPWLEDTNPEALLERCIVALQNAKHPQTDLGMPEQDVPMVWGILADSAESSFSRYAVKHQLLPVDPKSWLPVMNLAPEAFRSPDHQVINAVTRIVAVAPLADELLPDRFFEENIFNENEWVQRVCANTLSRRTQWKKLAEIGWKLAPKSQVIVLGALAYPHQATRYGEDRARDPNFDGEEKFWTHCMETMPVESACTLYLGHTSAYNSFNRIVHDPLHDYFAKEADKSDAASADFKFAGVQYSGHMVIEFLDSWHLDEDTPLLQRLLTYQGYEEHHIGRSDPKNPAVFKDFDLHMYTIRAAAKAALLKRGVPVSSDIVMEVDVTR